MPQLHAVQANHQKKKKTILHALDKFYGGYPNYMPFESRERRTHRPSCNGATAFVTGCVAFPVSVAPPGHVLPASSAAWGQGRRTRRTSTDTQHSNTNTSTTHSSAAQISHNVCSTTILHTILTRTFDTLFYIGDHFADRER